MPVYGPNVNKIAIGHGPKNTTNINPDKNNTITKRSSITNYFAQVLNGKGLNSVIGRIEKSNSLNRNEKIEKLEGAREAKKAYYKTSLIRRIIGLFSRLFGSIKKARKLLKELKEQI
jgi:hypothetical protein